MNHLCANYVLCSTLYVMNNHDQFLLLNHPKLKKWVPPGGKIEPNEMPQDAAIRECLEETGVEVKLLGVSSPLENGLITPYGLEYNAATSQFGSHLDFIYFGKVIQNPNESTFELSEEVKWLSIEDILNLETFDSIKKWCCFFLQKNQSNLSHF